MAFMGVRVLATKIVNSGVPIGKKPLLCPELLARAQVAFITGRHTEAIIRPPPFPYQQKKYTRFHCLFDNTVKRMNENSKLIVVEGSIASGKSAFAKQLADELDMLYIPEANLDSFYVNSYGKDFREMDPHLPESVRSCDVKKFYQHPNHRTVSVFQLRMYVERYCQHIDALAHIMNTGQGVVLERCVYSDSVFLETMGKFKYIKKSTMDYYKEVKAATIVELLHPHLVIYLDVPVSILQERIKKRAVDYEVKSKVLTKEYLTTLEEEYKKYLKEISKSSELLVYDWSNYGDVEVVVEDIERIDFDRFDKYDTRLRDWRFPDYWDVVDLRYLYTTKKDQLLSYFNVPIYNAPDVSWDPESSKMWRDAWHSFPGNEYRKGYNADLGDTGLLFKLREVPREIP